MTCGLCEWRYVSPRETSYRIDLFMERGTFVFFSSRWSRLVAIYSITITGSLDSGRKQMPRNWTMCGCRRSPISWHSFTNFFITFSTPSFWTLIRALWSVFPAQSIPFSSSFSTLPYDPVPSLRASLVGRLTFLRTNFFSSGSLWNWDTSMSLKTEIATHLCRYSHYSNLLVITQAYQASPFQIINAM